MLLAKSYIVGPFWWFEKPLAVRSVTEYTRYSRHQSVISQVDFSHYTDQPVDLAVALVNTVDTNGDALADFGQLKEFLTAYRNLWVGVADAPLKKNLGKVHKLRDSLHQVITAEDDAAASEEVNRILDDYGAAPRVSVHSGHPHLHFEPTGATMVSWLGTTTAMGLASVIVEHGVERFGVCDSGDCEDVYVDTSRNRSRRHCSSTCSTREAVAAYRKRNSETD